MSGPKPGTFQVDWDLFDSEAAEREAEEKAERRALLAKKRREEKEEKRLARLEAKEARRKKRERKIQKDIELKKEEERQHAISKYNEVKKRFVDSLVKRSELESDYPDLQLPDVPVIKKNIDFTDAQTIRTETSNLRKLIESYQREMDMALLGFLQNKADEESIEKIKEWSRSFKSKVVVKAGDIMPALNAETLYAEDKQRQDAMRTIIDKAHAAVKRLEKDEDVSDGILDLLDAIVEQNNVADAEVQLTHLQKLISNKINNKKELEEIVNKTKLKIQNIRKAKLVAEEVADVLEDLGYEVSDVRETAFSREGTLYAYNRSWADHAIRLEFDPLKQGVVSVPVRISSEEQSEISEADKNLSDKMDKQFDASWCSTKGIGSLAKNMTERGIQLKFSTNHEPGEITVEKITEADLGEKLQNIRRTVYKTQKLKTREIKK